MNDKGKNFIRIMFWTLILASFGWTTLVGGVGWKAIASTDEKSRDRDTEIVENMGEMKDEQNGKLDEIKTEQSQMKIDILVAITKLQEQVKKINGND